MTDADGNPIEACTIHVHRPGGPGAVSFDRALFRRAKPEIEDEHHLVDLT